MSDPEQGNEPLGQSILNSPFLLLGAGIVVMAVFYTIWGLVEILMLPTSNLP